MHGFCLKEKENTDAVDKPGLTSSASFPALGLLPHRSADAEGALAFLFLEGSSFVAHVLSNKTRLK